MALLKDALPSLLLIALLQATQPAFASGLVPVCTQAGVTWMTVDGEPADPRDDNQRSACAHGWCEPRRTKGSRGSA